MSVFVCTDASHREVVTAFGVRACVCVGKCEEQFEMIITPLRATQTKKGNTSEKGSRASQAEIEEQHEGNTKVILFSLTAS